jgi:hypothetical protein
MHTRLLVSALALVSLVEAAQADVVPPPRGVVEGRLGARAALPWAKPGRNFGVVVDTMFVAANLHTSDAIQTIEETWWTRPQPWPDVDIVIWFSTTQDPFFAAFYSPLANDIDGIGYGEHLTSMVGSSFPDVFDFSPDSLSGIVVANDYSGYVSQPWLLPITINQELGHKWCCFVRESTGAASATELLGRDDSHWSYFLDTGASPMEGNSWIDAAGSAFTTDTASVYAGGFGLTPFSELDLYVMGLVPPSEVDPFFVIQDPDVMGQRDLYNDIINRSSPPQYADDVTITGTRFDFSIDDVIARNGPRVPATWDGNLVVAFVLIVQPGEATNSAILEQFADIVDDSENVWWEATGHRSTLVNVTVPAFGEDGAACDGATLSCADGLDCVAYGGMRVCAAPCDGLCDGCCVDTDVGMHCLSPAVFGCEPSRPHGPGERCDDGLPCESGLCWADPDYDVSYCATVCETGADCPAGMSCLETTGSNLCFWDASPPGATGSPCQGADECDSSLCLGGHCVSLCDPGADECVPGTTCQPTSGDSYVCAPAQEGGGGCATGQGRGRGRRQGRGAPGGWIAVGIAVGVLALSSRRRRAPRA